MGYLLSLFYVVTGDYFLYIYQEMIKKFNLLWDKVIKFSNSNEKETIRGVSLKFCYFNYSATENTAISTRKKIQKKSLYLLHVIPFVHLFFWISAMKIIQAVFCCLHYQPQTFFCTIFHLLNLSLTIPLIIQCFPGFCISWSKILGIIKIKKRIR